MDTEAEYLLNELESLRLISGSRGRRIVAQAAEIRGLYRMLEAKTAEVDAGKPAEAAACRS